MIKIADNAGSEEASSTCYDTHLETHKEQLGA